MPKHEKGSNPDDEEGSNDQSEKPATAQEETKAAEPKESNGEGATPARDYKNLSDADRQDMKVDEIFALYLWWISKKVNSAFYQTVVKYAILFRECLNEIGW